MTNETMTDFDITLIESMGEALAHAKSETNSVRSTVYEFADAKAIREKLSMSQSEFSSAYGIPIQSLRHWEQRRHNPDRTASAYLWTIEAFPDQARAVQQSHQPKQTSDERQGI